MQKGPVGSHRPFLHIASCPQHEKATWQLAPSTVHELPMPLNMPGMQTEAEPVDTFAVVVVVVTPLVDVTPFVEVTPFVDVAALDVVPDVAALAPPLPVPAVVS